MRATLHGPVRSLSARLPLFSACLLLSMLGTTARAQTTTPVDQPVTVQPNQQNLSLAFTVYNDLAVTGIEASFSCSTSGTISGCVAPPTQELPADGSGNPLPTTVHVRFNSSGPGSGTLELDVTTTGSDEGEGFGSGSYQVTVAAPPPTYTVSVIPDGTPVSADANSSSNTYAFTVQDLGNTNATYTLTCSNTMGSCIKPVSVFVTKNGGTAPVTVTYAAGAAGTTGTVSLVATEGSYTNAGSVNVTAYSHTVSVTPTSGSDGTAVSATASQNNTASFTIKNTGTQQATYNLTKSCPGTTGTCTLSTSSVTINSGATASASVTYGAGADASAGSAHLTATYAGNSAVHDEGWVNWTASAPCESQTANASLTACTHAMLTVLTSTSGIKDTLTLATLSGAPFDYTLACNPTGPVTCTASGSGSVGSNGTDRIIVTTNAGSSDGNGTSHVVVTTPVGQVASSFPFEVLSTTSVVVSTSAGATHSIAGQPSSRSFTVHNAGHLSETFRLDTICTGVVKQCVRSATQVTLAAGASTNVSVSFVASGVSGVGTVGLKATHIRSSAVTSTATASVIEDHAPPSVALTPYNSDSYDPARCVAACFAATASYTTPAYTSLDVARGVTLVYSSATAYPRPVVQADVVDSSGIQADQLSIRLHGANSQDQTFANSFKEMFFTNAHQLRRLAVQFDTTAPLATGAYPYTLIVASTWGGDSTTRQETDLPIRVLVDNESASPYGAGWNIAGLEHLKTLGDSIMITDATGAAAFFRLQSCSTGCTYLSPPGDFTTLVKLDTADAHESIYERRTPDGTTIRFLPDGRIRTVTDRFGNQTLFGYVSGTNQVCCITDPVGKVTSLHYNAAGKLIDITDPMGRKTSITINSAGDLTQIQDPVGGLPLQATYDTKHRLLTLTDRASHISNFAYDTAGRLASVTLPTITVGGQPTRPVVRYRSPETAVLANQVAGTGTSSSPVAGIDTSTVRGTVTDPRGNATKYAVNNFGEPTRIEEPLGRVTVMTYDTLGHPKSVIAPSGHHTTYSWGGPDLIQTSDVTTGQTVNMSYEPTYHQVDTVSGDATSVINTWQNGRLMSTNVGGAVTSFTYDSFGRVLTSTDPAGHIDSVAYAPSGLRNRIWAAAAGRVTSFGGDAYGRVVRTTAPDSGVTTTVYDPLNRILQTIGPVHDTTVYTFGDGIHLTAVRDAKGQLYQSTVNALGWAESTEDPAGHTQTVVYDSAGNAVKTTDRAGRIITAYYDALNQADSIKADGQTTYFSTDSLGRFVAVRNAASTDTIRFDAAGRPDTVVTVRGTHRYVRASTYDDIGLRTKLVISGVWNDSISYGYDPVTHQLSTLTDLAGGVTNLGYNGDRLVNTVTLPTTGGLTITTSYPSTHTPSSIKYSNSFLNQALGVNYAYTADAQIALRTPAVPLIEGLYTGREFQYDSLQRLVGYDDYQAISGGVHNTSCDGTQSVSLDGYSCVTYLPGGKDTTYRYTFTYDSVGNRTDSGAVVELGNRMTQFGNDVLTYDPDGNLIDRSRTGFHQTYHWNSLGQLDTVTTNGQVVSFTYDGFGRRVSKTTASDTTRYIYDGQNLLAELDGAGNRVAEYTYYPGIDKPHSVQRWSGGTPSTYYYATELPNSVVGLIDSDNNLVDYYTYTPFGTLSDSTGTVPNSLRFGAREFDQETGLYYNRARYYDPTLGRFISEDPIGLAGGINPYVYAGNDPINELDPTGLTADDDGCTYLIGYYYDMITGVPVGQVQIIDVWCDGDPTPPPAPGGSSGGPGTKPKPQSNQCASALKTAGETQAAVARAEGAWSTLQAAATANGIEPALLAGIGVRETGFRNVWQSGGGSGAGVFQIDLSMHPGVTPAQAFNVPWAANYAAGMLASNAAYLRTHFPNFTASQQLQATAASYNFGVGNIHGNPNTIDKGTTHGNYGSNVVGLMSCFKK